MRFTLAIVAAAALAVAGIAVFFHERASAQQAAAVQREAAASAARAADEALPSRQPAATSAAPTPVDVAPDTAPTFAAPPAAPSATPAPSIRSADALPGIVVQAQPQANYAYPQARTYSNPAASYLTGWGNGVAAATADPEVQELAAQDQQIEAEVQSLARQLTDSDDEKERTELKPKLAAALEKQFDAQQKMRELEISRIEGRVQKLRELVRKRTDSRRKIIENRYEQLLNDAEGLGWNSTSTNGVQFVPQGLIGPRMPAPAGRVGVSAVPGAPPRTE